MSHRSLFSRILDGARRCHRKISYRRNHGGDAELVGTPGTSTTLVTVLAGYKERLWPLTLERIRRFVPNDVDVCIVTAGKRVAALESLCAANGWSYLWTAQNKTGLALNKAIAAHPSARRIFKLDEDIFLSERFFEDMADGYDAIEAQGVHRPGFCSPTINVNGVSYLDFLETLDLRNAYLETFGEVRQACGGVRAHFDPQAAAWLWRQSLPVDDVARRFREREDAAARLIGMRFSIGAIYFDRDFWTEIGGFAAPWSEGLLGIDETVLCAECVERCRPMFYLTNVFVGHFSFGPQESGMMSHMDEWISRDPVTFAARS